MRFPFSVLAICLILVSAIAGCPGNRTVSNGDQAANKGGSGETNAEDVLTSAIHQLQPENYSIAAAADKPINLLNSWRSLVSDAAPAASVENLPAGWINDDETARWKAGNYDARDAIHIRDAMLNHSIAGYLAARSEDELEQVRAVFDFVVRNTALRGPDELDLPLGIYEILLLGQGTAEDRAWLIATVLKQIRVDCVVVRPAGDAGSEADAWLLGIVLKGQVYLFDPRLGIALPSTEDLSAANGTPATLAEIVSHPQWLHNLALRADQPYAIDAESLKSVDIFPIVEANYWSDRMKHLESMLPASEICVLYDPLLDDSGRTGLLSRLQSSGGWKPDQLKPWPYPHQQSVAARSPSPAIRQAFDVAFQTFGLPVPYDVDSSTQSVKLGNPERKMLRIRTDQLLGKFDEATKRYLSIRHLEIEPSPIPELNALNRMGAENAIYWTAICKFESQEYSAAVEQLNGYLKRYDRNGRWAFAARALLADCHAQLGQFAQAIETLERTRSDDPYRAANAIRVKQWKARKTPDAK